MVLNNISKNKKLFLLLALASMICCIESSLFAGAAPKKSTGTAAKSTTSSQTEKSSSTTPAPKPVTAPKPAPAPTALSPAEKIKQERELIKAIQAGDFDKVEELLDNGVSANAKDAEGETALMHACKRGDLDVVKLLLEKRARVNATTTLGETALMFAAKKGSKKIVEALIEAGADVDARDSFGGYTPLMLATMGGHLPVVELLVEHKAATNTVNKQKYTALDLANQSKNAGIAAFLKEKGTIATVKEKEANIAKPGEYRPPVRPHTPSYPGTGGYTGSTGGYPSSGTYPGSTGGYPGGMNDGIGVIGGIGGSLHELERERDLERGYEMGIEAERAREMGLGLGHSGLGGMEEEMLRESMRETGRHGGIGLESELGGSYSGSRTGIGHERMGYSGMGAQNAEDREWLEKIRLMEGSGQHMGLD